MLTVNLSVAFYTDRAKGLKWGFFKFLSVHVKLSCFYTLIMRSVLMWWCVKRLSQFPVFQRISKYWFSLFRDRHGVVIQILSIRVGWFFSWRGEWFRWLLENYILVGHSSKTNLSEYCFNDFHSSTTFLWKDFYSVYSCGHKWITPMVLYL